MNVYIAGEDDVTKAIIVKLLDFCMAKYNIIEELPARGGRIKSLILSFNKLAEKNPVILLLDLDTSDCAPSLIKILLKNEVKHSDLILRIAVDEGESWLMSDREGFSRFFSVPINKIPLAKIESVRKSHICELDFPYKSSLFLMREIMPFSKDENKKRALIPRDEFSKGPEYNTDIIFFIQNHWNIENALKNSYSLTRAVNRLKEFSKNNIHE